MNTRITLTPKEAAHTLGLSVASLYKAMGCGELPSLAFGKRRLIHQDDLAAYIAAHRVAVHVPSERPVDKAVRRRPRKHAETVVSVAA